MRRVTPTICLCLAILAGCEEFPELDAKLSDEAREADRPKLGFNRVILAEGESIALDMDALETMVERLETAEKRMEAALADAIIAGAERDQIGARATDLRAEAAAVEKRIAAELAAASASDPPDAAPTAEELDRLRRLGALREDASEAAGSRPKNGVAGPAAPTEEEIERLRRLEALRQRAAEPVADPAQRRPAVTAPERQGGDLTEAERERRQALEELRKRAGRVAEDK